MSDEIKNIITREFKGLRKSYEIKVNNKKDFLEYLEDELIECINEINKNDKTSEEYIQCIKVSIKESRSYLRIYEDELKDVNKVLDYLCEEVNSND